MRLKSVFAASVLALMLPLSASAGTIVNYGSLDDGEWADLWVVQSLGGWFAATTVPSFNHLGGFLDTQLFLMDSTGVGIVSNDDITTVNSAIGANLAAGTYLLAVTLFNNDPLSDTGPIFADLTTGQVPGNGKVFNGSFSGGPAGYPYNGPYTLTTDGAESVAPVPEPATLLLMGSGLVGAASRKLRRRKQQLAN